MDDYTIIAGLQDELEMATERVHFHAHGRESIQESLNYIRSIPGDVGKSVSNRERTAKKPRRTRVSVQEPGMIRNTAYDVLLEEGGPLHRRIILERIIERGVEVGGDSPLNNFGGHMSHDERFVSLDNRGTWDLRIRREGSDTLPSEVDPEEQQENTGEPAE